MYPTLSPGDRVSVDNSPGKLGRGDIAYFVPEAGGRLEPDTLLVSRVVGLPGEEISKATRIHHGKASDDDPNCRL